MLAFKKRKKIIRVSILKIPGLVKAGRVYSHAMNQNMLLRDFVLHRAVDYSRFTDRQFVAAINSNVAACKKRLDSYPPKLNQMKYFNYLYKRFL